MKDRDHFYFCRTHTAKTFIFIVQLLFWSLLLASCNPDSGNESASLVVSVSKQAQRLSTGAKTQAAYKEATNNLIPSNLTRIDISIFDEAENELDKVDILQTGIGDHRRASCLRREVRGCLGEQLARGLGFKPGSQFPGKDPPTEVVDDGVQVGASAVEQPDDRGVDVPNWVWLLRTNALFGLGRIDSPPWAEPAAFTHEAPPSRRRGEDATDALGMQCERADGHVSIGLGSHHVPHRADFLGRELGGRGTWAARAIVERTLFVTAAPGMKSGGRKAEDAQDDREKERFLRVANRGQNQPLAAAIGYPRRLEVEAGKTNDEESQPDDGEKEPDSALEGEDLGLKLRLVEVENVDGDNGPRATADPANRSRARDTEVLEETGVTFLTGEVAHAVVVGTAAGSGRHGAW